MGAPIYWPKARIKARIKPSTSDSQGCPLNHKLHCCGLPLFGAMGRQQKVLSRG